MVSDKAIYKEIVQEHLFLYQSVCDGALEILAENFRRKIEKGVEKGLLIRSLPNNTDMRKR